MGHCEVPEAEAILDQELPVLNKGFVRLVDYMGCDRRIVEAARVSYGGGTKTFRQDKGLIHYLLRNRHTSPFEQVVFTFHVKMPIFVARQWIRHRTARVNEISGRYSVMEAEFYVPDPDVVAGQSSSNKQGREEEPLPEDAAERVIDAIEASHRREYGHYEKLLEEGVARELARIVLPLSLYTELYWQIDLHNLFHFLELRLDPHAQYEIRAYAETILDVARRVCPIATDAFNEYVRGAVTFSAQEHQVLMDLIDAYGDHPPAGPPPSGEVRPELQSLCERHGLTRKAAERLAEKLRRRATGIHPAAETDSPEKGRA
ncbi:MAG: FAD-dependent thymidylate synthase [bacterium]